MASDRLIVRQTELGPMMNFIYLIGCAETGQAAVIDPAWDIPAVLALAREQDLDIRAVLLTHAHPDHINGLGEILDETGSAVYINAEEIGHMKEMAGFFHVSLDFMKRHEDRFHPIGDGAEIEVGKLVVRALHTPGHTPGSQCFLVEDALFSGDTLFIDACGRADLPGGDPGKLWWSLNRRLRALPDDIILYPGHAYSERRTSSLGEQKRTNPYMQYPSLESFLRALGVP